MSEEMTSIQKLVEFLYSIGLPPMRILRGLIALLVIGAIVGALYFFNFDSLRSTERPDDDPDSELVDTDRPTYEFDLTLDQQIDELTFYDPRQSSYVVVYGELQKQNETIEELRQRPAITPGQTNKLDEIQLRNLRTLFLRTMQTGVSADHERKAFEDFALKMASNSSDEQQKDLAEFALVRTAVQAFGFKPTEASGQAAIEALNQYQATFVNTTSRAEVLLATLLKSRQTHPTRESVDTCVEAIGKVFSKSTESDVQDLANKIGEFSLFAKLDLTTLENRIRYQDRNALMDLDKALRVLEAHPELEVGKWELLMRCSEASLSTGRINDFATGQNIIGQLVAKLPDSDPRKTKLAACLTRQKTRAQQFGKTFDLTGTTLNEKQIAQSTGDYSVLMLLDRSQQSIGMMRELSSVQLEGGKTFRPVIAFKDKFTGQDIEKVNQIPPRIFVANEDTAQKYLRSFPTDFFPYILLVDKDGVVVAGNLSLVQVANRIAALNRDRKTAAESLLGQ